MELVSRDAAKALGLKRYFTGIPCTHGHVSERYVRNHGCVACEGEHARKYRSSPAGKEYVRRYVRSDKSRQNGAAWRARKKNDPRYQDAASRKAKRWRATPEGAASLMYTRARIRSAGKEFDLTRPYVLTLLRAALEAMPFMRCGGKTPNSASIDRIDASRGYVQGNVRIIPQWWNYAKHDGTDEELFAAMAAAGWIRAK